MKDKELWLKKLKEKLEDYSEPTPASGWERLEKELSASDRNASPLVGEPTPRRIRPYRPWSVAAAAAVLVALSLLGIYFLETPEAEFVRQLSSVSVPDVLPKQVTPHSMDELENVIETARPVVGRKVAIASRPVVEAMEPVEERKPDAVSETGNNDQPTTQAETNEPAQRANENKEQATTQQPGKRTNGFTTNRDRNLALATSRTRKGGNWSVGMAVGSLGQTNLMDAGTDRNAQGTDMMFSPVYGSGSLGSSIPIPNNADFYFKDGMPYLQSKDDVVEAKHKQSFSFGLSIRKELTKEFSVETGLMYTLLSSDIKTAGSNAWKDQKLHYIGIPLRAGWSFYRQEGVTLYTSAGGAVEKCISGKLGDEKQTVDEWQFSVGGSLGVQFNLNKRLGLYAEPGVTYYFDDGSKVETVRKDKPFGFSLQAGIRLNY